MRGYSQGGQAGTTSLSSRFQRSWHSGSGTPSGASARAVAHLRAARAVRRGTRTATGPGTWPAESADLRGGARRGDAEARLPRSGCRSTAISRAAPSIRAASPRTGTAPTCWSRTGRPSGRAVLLHGLTDSPYSLRHIARALSRARLSSRSRSRLPAHGTVPGALTEVEWEDWLGGDAARGARGAPARAGAGMPLHIVGFSNGGALAMKYALDAHRGPGAGAARPARADLADDRHHRVRALRRRRRLARLLPGLREGGLARRAARVQPVQVQLVPGQRRAPVASC